MTARNQDYPIGASRMAWRDEVAGLLDGAITELAKYGPGQPGYHRAQGYAAGLQHALDVGPAALPARIAEVEETARIQREVLRMVESASPRLYTAAELEAL